MEKLKSKKGNLKRMFHTSGTKHGSYSVGMTVLVVAVIIVLNLVVGQIRKHTEILMSAVQRFMTFPIHRKIC